MGTDTKLRPDRTKLRTERPMAPPATRRRTRSVLWVLALAGVAAVALVIAVLVGTGPTDSESPTPGVSPVQAERWGAADEAADREVQRFRNAVDVDRLTATPGAPAADLTRAERIVAARHELRAMQAAVREVPALGGVLHDDMQLRMLVGSGQVPIEALDVAS